MCLRKVQTWDQTGTRIQISRASSSNSMNKSWAPAEAQTLDQVKAWRVVDGKDYP